MSEAQSLSGKTAVVTGASSGIGRAIAERLGAAQMHVFLCGRTASSMEESKARIEASGGAAVVVVADVRVPSAVFSLVDRVLRTTGRLDIMVNNAGMSHPEPIMEGTPEQWRAMLETNVLGLLAGCQAAAKAMRSCRTEGHIVNISSIAAQLPDSGVYGATKHAVTCISHTLRRALENDSIRVVNIEPGGVASNFCRHFEPAALVGFFKRAGIELQFEKGDCLPRELFERLQKQAKQSLSSVEDVADAVLYAVTRPIHVNVAEIVVRPAKQPIVRVG